MIVFTLAALHLGSTATAGISAAVPAGAALLAIPALGEVPTAFQWAGVAVGTVGLAIVLARAGLPVPARKLRLGPRVRLCTCMRVQDDLSRGASRFHAEVTRLKQCVDVARSDGPPLLCLLDEILGGTNSRERHLGALGVIKSLAAEETIVLVSTHDLALADLAGERGEQMRIVHFRDDVRDGRMHFDYRMREGVLPSTNALRVMRLAGLEVEVELEDEPELEESR